MSENDLLQVQEGPFVMHSMSNLDLGDPSMRGVACFTVIALLVCYDEFNHKGLLKHRVMLHFFLNCYFDFNSSGMGFSPNKSSIQKFHSFQAFDVLQAQGKQLSTF